MATKYEYYNVDDDTYTACYDANWKAQTFTPATAHKITSVKLLIYRSGSPGTLTVSIRATSAGKPTGGDLCSGTTDGDTLTLDSAGEWREITLGAGYDLDADTMYAIVIRALDGSSTHSVRCRFDDNDGAYAGGTRLYSSNSGVAWTDTATDDMMFEEWGVSPVVGRSFGFIIG